MCCLRNMKDERKIPVKEVRIGLFGAIVNNDNMGCCALTYSLLTILDEISRMHGYSFTYIVFERLPDEQKIELLGKTLQIPRERLTSASSARFIRIYKWKENKKCIENIKKCDLIIDLTQGDSFADIYGMARFVSYTLDKLIVEKCKVPLILGPQTYGPYEHCVSRKIAQKVIDDAFAVFSRDKTSTDYLGSIGVKNTICTVTDLAFGLPYNSSKNSINKAGFNPSGLLWPQKVESTETNFHMECNYEFFCNRTIELLLNKGYEVHLIPHVGADQTICDILHERYPKTICAGKFDNPVSVKSYIAAMDVFIGARMHATIAALSAGVAVLPVSYSRKFQGLYSNLEYPYCIDLIKMSTDQAVEYCDDFINNDKTVKEKILHSMEQAQNMHTHLRIKLADKIIYGLAMRK